MGKNIEKFLNYTLGIFGLGFIGVGLIMTFGGLNIMEIDASSHWGINPGDLFQSPVMAFLFIFLPILLVKHTIGKFVKFFDFSKLTIILVITLAVIAGFIAEVGKTYNYFAYVDEDITKSYKDIDILYKKNFDLTTKVESVTKDYMKYEGEAFSNIAQARYKYLNSNSVDDKVNAANNFDQGLKSLFVVVENYPQLKANENVKELISVIITNENQLANYKQSYNEKVKLFNANVRQFPFILITRPFGINTRSYFEEESLNLKNPREF